MMNDDFLLNLFITGLFNSNLEFLRLRFICGGNFCPQELKLLANTVGGKKMDDSLSSSSSSAQSDGEVKNHLFNKSLLQLFCY